MTPTTAMTLRLRNTLTRTVEPSRPRDGQRFRMYSCGPTVYRYAHVGNLRTFLLADLVRRVVLYHGHRRSCHVQNITDVGHLRDERFDRGEDRMLVAAGLEHKTTRRDRRRVRGRVPRRRGARSTSCPRTSTRGRPSTSPRWSSSPSSWSTPGHAYVSDDGNVYYAVAVLPGLRRAVRQHARRAAGRPSRRGRGRQARPGRLRALEGRRRGPDAASGRRRAGARASRAGISSARRWPCATSAPRFDVHTGGDRQRLPPSRGRDRPVGADRRRAAGAGLGPRRVPPCRRPEDGEVGRQHRADRRRRRRAASTRSRSATSA